LYQLFISTVPCTVNCGWNYSYQVVNCRVSQEQLDN